MARIENIDIPNKKRVVIGLTSIYGIGKTVSQLILHRANVSEDTRVGSLDESELSRIRDEIRRMTQETGELKIEGILRTDVKINKKRLIDIRSYRGSRLRKGLPSRGQSTRQNARTCKGPKRTVANKKKAPK